MDFDDAQMGTAHVDDEKCSFFFARWIAFDPSNLHWLWEFDVSTCRQTIPKKKETRVIVMQFKLPVLTDNIPTFLPQPFFSMVVLVFALHAYGGT